MFRIVCGTNFSHNFERRMSPYAVYLPVKAIDKEPIDPSDLTGLYMRADTELFIENFSEAIKYYELVGAVNSIKYVYSLQQIGEIEKANQIISDWKLKNEQLINQDQNLPWWNNFNIAFAEREIDTMVQILTQQQKSMPLFILERGFLHWPMFKTLRESPQWPAIAAETKRRADILKAEYVSLSSQELSKVLKEYCNCE